MLGFDAILVVGPEHARVFADAGWDRARVLAELDERLQIPGAELVRGAGGIDEGLPAAFADTTLPKFRPGGILLACAGGGAGLFSAIIGGWANGDDRQPARHPGGAVHEHAVRPRPDRRAARSPSVSGSTGRPAIAGLRVGLLDISKPRGDVFLDRIEARLAEAGATVQRYRKPTFTKPAPVDLRHEIATQCDVVIEALAD